jgi:hypothetical protein
MPTHKPRTTIYLEPELFQALEQRAKQEKRTMSNLCNLLMEQAMEIWLKTHTVTNPIPDRPEDRQPTAATKATVAKAKGGKASKGAS